MPDLIGHFLPRIASALAQNAIEKSSASPPRIFAYVVMPDLIGHLLFKACGSAKKFLHICSYENCEEFF
jgi:hypothetical protein